MSRERISESRLTESVAVGGSEKAGLLPFLRRAAAPPEAAASRVTRGSHRGLVRRRQRQSRIIHARVGSTLSYSAQDSPQHNAHKIERWEWMVGNRSLHSNLEVCWVESGARKNISLFGKLTSRRRDNCLAVYFDLLSSRDRSFHIFLAYKIVHSSGTGSIDGSGRLGLSRDVRRTTALALLRRSSWGISKTLRRRLLLRSMNMPFGKESVHQCSNLSPVHGNRRPGGWSRSRGRLIDRSSLKRYSFYVDKVAR